MHDLGRVNWKLEYIGKLGVQKVLGGVPGLYRCQEFVKAATGRLESRIDAGFVAQRFEDKVAQFLAAGVRPPRLVVEQGTGWHGADLVLFHLAGAKQIVTYDTRPWLRPVFVRAIALQAPELAGTVASWTADEPAVRERAAALARLAADPRVDIMRTLSATYHVTSSMRRESLQSCSVDLFYSDSVMQRIEPSYLASLLSETRRALSAGGQTHHVIDCKDFHAIDDARVPELAYLRPSERAWRLCTSRYLNYQNRLRLPQMVAIFERAGFEVRTLAERRTEANLAFARAELAHLPAWRELSPEELAVSRFELVGTPRSPEAAVPSSRECAESTARVHS